MVTLTPSALTYVNELITKTHPGAVLRITIEEEGCSGFAYALDIVNYIDPADKEFLQSDGSRVYVDSEKYPIIEGLVINYVKKELNGEFEFINPNEEGSCGCGKSFNVKKTGEHHHEH